MLWALGALSFPGKGARLQLRRRALLWSAESRAVGGQGWRRLKRLFYSQIRWDSQGKVCRDRAGTQPHTHCACMFANDAQLAHTRTCACIFTR